MIKRKNYSDIDTTAFNEFVDFTLLDPRAVEQDIHTLINVAIKNKYCAVCVNPCNVKPAKMYIEKTLNTKFNIVSVIGFPLGANTIKTKVFETKQAIKDGADEIDFVVNIAKIKEADYNYLKNEITKVLKAAKNKIVKAIIETCYLTRDEIKNISRLCDRLKVDFIKTSTGYGTQGATVEDVILIKENVKKTEIKASGGIRTKEQAEELLRAGATRIGSSKTL